MTALSVMPARIISTTIVTSHTIYTVFCFISFQKDHITANRQMVVVSPFACLLLFIYFCRILSFLLFLPVFLVFVSILWYILSGLFFLLLLVGVFISSCSAGQQQQLLINCTYYSQFNSYERGGDWIVNRVYCNAISWDNFSHFSHRICFCFSY